MEEFPPIEIQFSNKSTVFSLRQEVCKKRWQFIFLGACMENTAFFRIENVAVKDFKAQLNEYENVVELEDDHTLQKFEWLVDNVHVVIMNPKHKSKRSGDKSALTSFEEGEKSSCK
ncbi:hypothetical protein OnM2_048082 [Erysiphe neolycopersici]|uniref:Uncharacterized protein n=1 Tax=Erysiphe neolycopersici TaxID=212602 RepID=A0A420HTD9_9PEZI|nr:hypothetical protein OnM2_048082 [Erysiphe neolycopersici]